MKIVVLWTDAVVFFVLTAAILYAWKVARTPHMAETWRKVFASAPGAAAATVLGLFVVVGILDSFHYRPLLQSEPGAAPAYAPETHSLLDKVLAHEAQGKERSYSAPLAFQAHEKEAVTDNGVTQRIYPRLLNAATHLQDPPRDWARDVAIRAAMGGALGLLSIAALTLIGVFVATLRSRRPAKEIWRTVVTDHTRFRWRAVLLTLTVVFALAGIVVSLAQEYHVFGTDRVGNDLLYVVLKS
ncbi:MAG: ABC transporter permease, partial [Casimicrobiaceae bacterium]